MADKKFSFEHYMHLAYGPIACTQDESATLRACGVEVASKAEAGVFHIGVPPGSIDVLKVSHPVLGQRLYQALACKELCTHPQAGAKRARPMYDLSKQELLDEITYERSRSAWIAHASSDDLKTDQDREDHRVFFNIPGRPGLCVRVFQMENEMAMKVKLEQAASTDPLLEGLEWGTDSSVSGVLVRILKDKENKVWGRSHYSDETLASARRNRAAAMPAHHVTRDQFVSSCLVFEAQPGRQRSLVHDDPYLSGGNMEALYKHFGDVFDRLHACDDEQQESVTRKAWVTSSISSLLTAYPSDNFVYFDSTKNPLPDKLIPPGRIVRIAPGSRPHLGELHRSLVEAAHQAGEKIPPHVLAAYPELHQREIASERMR